MHSYKVTAWSPGLFALTDMQRGMHWGGGSMGGSREEWRRRQYTICSKAGVAKTWS